MDAEFLGVLFDHRQFFYSIGVRSNPHDVSSSATTISWVDVLLAKLGDFILTVASGLCRSNTSGYLQNQREGDGIRAATQLPGTLLPFIECTCLTFSREMAVVGEHDCVESSIPCSQTSCIAAVICSLCHGPSAQ